MYCFFSTRISPEDLAQLRTDSGESVRLRLLLHDRNKIIVSVPLSDVHPHGLTCGHDSHEAAPAHAERESLAMFVYRRI